MAAAIPGVRVADVDYNVQQIENLIAQAEGKGAEVIVFPELSVTGYTCQDLFRQQLLLEKAEEAIIKLLDFTRKLDIISVVGVPVRIGPLLYNCAVVVQGGTILGVVPKTYLPNYCEFYEKRWFASAADLMPQDIYLAGSLIHVSAEPIVFRTCDGVGFGIEICEDVWAPLPPSNNLALAGADIILNLSATDELLGKHNYLCSLLAQQSARMMCGYVYSSCGFGESTQDVVYGGNAMIFENGRQLATGDRFSLEPQLQIQQIDVERLRGERQNNTTFRTAQDGATARVVYAKSVNARPFELVRPVNPHPFIPEDEQMTSSCEEILNIQTMGLCRRLHHTHCDKAVIGISGGLDSTLALLVTVRAFDKRRMSMPEQSDIAPLRRGVGAVSVKPALYAERVTVAHNDIKPAEVDSVVRRLAAEQVAVAFDAEQSGRRGQGEIRSIVRAVAEMYHALGIRIFFYGLAHIEGAAVRIGKHDNDLFHFLLQSARRRNQTGRFGIEYI